MCPAFNSTTDIQTLVDNKNKPMLSIADIENRKIVRRKFISNHDYDPQSSFLFQRSYYKDVN